MPDFQKSISIYYLLAVDIIVLLMYNMSKKHNGEMLMTDIKLFIDTAGSTLTPQGWYILHKVKMQRLYYIKGGTGTYSCDGKAPKPFEVGKIYLFPYNVNISFDAKTEDPIDHIYFDFVSAPPIISDGPVVYEVQEGSAIHKALLLADQLFSEYHAWSLFQSPIPHITSAEPGSYDEQRQTMYQMLKVLLILLSAKAEIPFSTDEVINDTVEYIRKNYMTPITIKKLAIRAGLEENYFIRRFKSVMGQTPYAYLKSHRLLCASELITNGASLSQASEMVGYENPSSLSRAMGKRRTIEKDT